MILEVQNLRFSYNLKSGDNTTSVDGPLQGSVCLDELLLRPGESLALLGPSGSGKTTLLHLFAGLLRPYSGSVAVRGFDLFDMSHSALDRFRGKHIGMVFQRHFLLPGLSVRQNVELAQQLARVPQDAARVDSLLRELKLEELSQKLPATLSHGQAQRVAIARALVHRPALVLADEPTSALDDDNSSAALRLLQESAGVAGSALLLVTHDQRIRGQLDRDLLLEAI